MFTDLFSSLDGANHLLIWAPTLPVVIMYLTHTYNLHFTGSPLI
nr:ATP synthase F0 subunit 6 [Levantina rechingeri]